VVLEGNQRQGKAGVAAKPEKEGDVESGLRKGIAGSAHLGGTTVSSARSGDVGERGVSYVGKLSGVANHLEVAALLLRGESELVPDVHPVSELTVNALTTNLDLNLGNKLLTDEIQPTGIDSSIARSLHGLVNLRESDLEVCAVSKVSVSGDSAGHTATKVSLTREGLLNTLHREVGVSTIRDLPEGDLGGSSKENVLCAVGD
jgi:hypothetical protein